MAQKKDRLKEIQEQLDLLMDEVHRLRENIAGESRRRTFPFPFERAVVNEMPDPDLGGSKSSH